MPHSNFSEVLDILQNGRKLTVEGPLADIDSDCVRVVVSAWVTQQPKHVEPGGAQGPTCADRVELTSSGEASLADATRWGFDADAYGGTFDEGWAFAQAEQVEQAEDGAIETYIWSQWVWLRTP